MSLVGQTVGEYRVVAELGRGQHSVVFKAWQPSLERWVALKVLQQGDEATLRKFQDEAQLTAHLIQQGVPNIRRLYEVGQTPQGRLFVALEYVDNSLLRALRRARARGRRISPPAAAKLLQPLAEALDAMHSLGWVHLDVKPQNILISKGNRAMLADFGIARRIGVRTQACTPAYASPEQAAGDRPVGPWSDIYALGVVLYEMTSGQPPFRGEQDIILLNQHLETEPPSPRNANPAISASQEQAILRPLAKAPEKRPQTACQCLEPLLPPGSATSMFITPIHQERAAPSRHLQLPRQVLVGALVLLIVALLALLGWALSGPVF